MILNVLSVFMKVLVQQVFCLLLQFIWYLLKKTIGLPVF